MAGGAGFIGSNFLRHVLSKHKDWNVTMVDNFSFSRLENIADVRDRITFEKIDISEYGNLDHLMKDQDYVVNFAAQTHVDRSITNSRPFVVTELLGTDNLLSSARKMNVARYLQVSTDEVYGEIEVGSFKVNDPLNPRNPYSAAKAGADLLVKASWYTYNFPTLITRCSNNYGPYQHLEKFIPKTISCALSNQRIPIYGDGKQVRDWIHVLDHCAAIDTVLVRGKPGTVYHVAADNEMKNIDIAKLILSSLGKSEQLLENVADRIGHDRRYSLDTTETRNLGWSPAIDFESGLKSTLEWYVANKDWWRPLLTAAS